MEATVTPKQDDFASPVALGEDNEGDGSTFRDEDSSTKASDTDGGGDGGEYGRAGVAAASIEPRAPGPAVRKVHRSRSNSVASNLSVGKHALLSGVPLPRSKMELELALDDACVARAALAEENERLRAKVEELTHVEASFQSEQQIRMLLERQEDTLKDTLRQVILELDRTKCELIAALQSREDAEDAREHIESELEDLTQTLFQEANELVSTEARKAYTVELEKDQLARELAATKKRMAIDQAVMLSLQRRVVDSTRSPSVHSRQDKKANTSVISGVNRSLQFLRDGSGTEDSVLTRSLENIRHPHRPHTSHQSAVGAYDITTTDPEESSPLSPVRLSRSAAVPRPSSPGVSPVVLMPTPYDARAQTLPRGFQPHDDVPNANVGASSVSDILKGRLSREGRSRTSDDVFAAENPPGIARGDLDDSAGSVRRPSGLANYACPSPERSRSPDENSAWLDRGQAPVRGHSDEMSTVEAELATVEAIRDRSVVMDNTDLVAYDMDEGDSRLYSEVVRFVLSAEVVPAALFQFSSMLMLLDTGSVDVIGEIARGDDFEVPVVTEDDVEETPFRPRGTVVRDTWQAASAHVRLEKLLKEDVKICLNFPGPLSVSAWRFLDYEDAVPPGVSREAGKTRPWPFGDRESRAVARANIEYAKQLAASQTARDATFRAMIRELPAALHRNEVIVEPISQSLRQRDPTVGEHPCDMCSASLPVAFFTMNTPKVNTRGEDFSAVDAAHEALRLQCAELRSAACAVRPRAFVLTLEKAPEEKWFTCRWCRNRVVAANNLFAFWRNVRTGVFGKTRAKAVYLQFLVLRMHLAHARVASDL